MSTASHILDLALGAALPKPNELAALMIKEIVERKDATAARIEALVESLDAGEGVAVMAAIGAIFEERHRSAAEGLAHALEWGDDHPSTLKTQAEALAELRLYSTLTNGCTAVARAILRESAPRVQIAEGVVT